MKSKDTKAVSLICVRCKKEVTPLILKRDGLVCESCEEKEGKEK